MAHCQICARLFLKQRTGGITMTQHINTLIIGAGISGVGVAVHLKKNAPQRDYLIFEGRDQIGGTWSLFKYPGIRSDSDMSTFGYKFKPWREDKVLADAGSICNYLQETVDEFDLYPHIRFNHRIQSANWNSDKGLWELKVLVDQQKVEQWTANFVIGCTGYYNYDQGFQPKYPQESDFKGQIVHPQHWPEDLDIEGKKVVIIGSGATAITLVPAMAKQGAHVTMLQRSPTYIATVPSIDFAYNAMRKVLPESLAYDLTRRRNIGFQRAIFKFSKSHPERIKKLLLAGVRHQLKGKVDMKHFTPTYNPWDQRLCVVPDGDLFKILREGKAFIETDHIEKLTEQGILLKSGKVLDADIIVSATGLEIQLLGGLTATIDGKSFDAKDHMMYQGTMISNVPNFALVIGYTNASWTLKVDLIGDYLSRLLSYMDKNNLNIVTPEEDPTAKSEHSLLGSALTSGYVVRANKIMPRQGLKAPWMAQSSYYADRDALKSANFKDGILKFEKSKTAEKSKKRFKLFG